MRHTIMQLVGISTMLAGVVMLAGYGWALLVAGSLLCAISTLAEVRAVQAAARQLRVDASGAAAPDGSARSSTATPED